jgi:hypothetical protein
VFSEYRKCYFRDPNFKNFLGICPQTDPHNFGERVLSWGRARKMGFENQFCPTTEESLKNALVARRVKYPEII